MQRRLALSGSLSVCVALSVDYGCAQLQVMAKRYKRRMRHGYGTRKYRLYETRVANYWLRIWQYYGRRLHWYKTKLQRYRAGESRRGSCGWPVTSCSCIVASRVSCVVSLSLSVAVREMRCALCGSRPWCFQLGESGSSGLLWLLPLGVRW
jgi:hypothetical protein